MRAAEKNREFSMGMFVSKTIMKVVPIELPISILAFNSDSFITCELLKTSRR